MSIDDATPEEWNKVTHTAQFYNHKRLASMAEEESKKMVEEPPHYNKGNIECIEAIQESMSLQEFKGYLKGNAIKYLWRYTYKDKPKEDLEKAKWYLERLIEQQV
jgi:hypothetical protein